ncbi:hypothetical protein [Anaeromyxobacter paludicola]|uniref:DUF5666 domain-containing protein n=1 Tax=Anaeromyxobacter paludicola TaxID=2918171 RepID=A0ABM7X716_9BACT|nr:hypothetical protein [Anaeromyxobacter paludicola]BDG07593.1 hypothetical protein AMPC_07060 [Anaeromyxobacter paludicola]
MARLSWWAAVGALVVGGAAGAAEPGSAQVHVRGDVVSLQGGALQLRTRSGDLVALQLPENAKVALVSKGDPKLLRSGAFVGTAAVPEPDGRLRALEVHVFPSSMRGTGEGHHPWDLKPGSTMTNATVAEVGPGGAGSQGTGSSMTNATVSKVGESGGARELSLQYPGGEKKVLVPEGTPVLQVEPGNRSSLVPGAHVFAVASRRPDGTLVAERLNVGKDGVVPPM